MKAFLRSVWATMLSMVLLLATQLSAAATPQPTQQQLLDELPQVWARAASAGKVDQLLALYDKDAFIHVVFTSDELHGHEQIAAYYTKHSQQPPKVSITRVEESSIVASVGILSGNALVEFPGQAPLRTHFSIVAKWMDARWNIQIQYTSRLDP